MPQDAVDDFGRGHQCHERAASAAGAGEYVWEEDAMEELCPRQHSSSCGVREMMAPGARPGRWLRWLDGFVGWVGDDLAAQGCGGSQYPDRQTPVFDNDKAAGEYLTGRTP